MGIIEGTSVQQRILKKNRLINLLLLVIVVVYFWKSGGHKEASSSTKDNEWWLVLLVASPFILWILRELFVRWLASDISRENQDERDESYLSQED